MRSTIIAIAGATLVAASPLVERACVSSAPAFQIATVNQTTAKRDIERRQAGKLMITITDGKLTDQDQRIGYVAANDQLQFDAGQPQAGAKETTGFALCDGNKLALNGDTTWYACLSGDFYNLYSKSQGGQCSKIFIESLGAGSSGSATTAGGASQISDGQVQATSAAVSQISDGQPQAPSAITQISDGQIQAPSAITQISDGQIQAPTSGAAVTQISDGQIQAPTSTAAPVTQISDGQIQAPTSTAAPVTQISDGQIQAPTSTGGAISQISDGQIQAPTSTAAAISQIGDGQIQAPTNATVQTPTASQSPFTGAASSVSGGFFSLVAAGFMAVFLL